MNRSEILKAINAARQALAEAQRLKVQKTATLTEQAEDTQIKRAAVQLLKESANYGAAGEPCPTCGGSGRI